MSAAEISASTRHAEAARLAYKAFFSYSHAADGTLAAALQAALQRFARPWYRRRAIRIFRDTTGLGPTPDLWDSIRTALEDSEYFVLFASERAASSRWIELELDAWLRKSSSDRLLIVWTDGALVWDSAAGDFDWERTTSLHPRLRGAFRAEPLHLDLRWARTRDDLSPRRPEFLDAVARLSATLRRLPLEDLVGEDVRQHRRTRVLAGSAVTVLVVLLVAAVAAASFAFQQRNVARQQLVELMVANGTREVDEGDLSGAALWFAEALRLDGRSRERSLQRIRLRAALDAHPALQHVWIADSTVVRRRVMFGRDGRYVVSEGLKGEGEGAGGTPGGVGLPDGPGVWDAHSGEPLTLSLPAASTGRVLAVDAAADRVRVLIAGADGPARVVDGRSGAELALVDHPGEILAAAFSHDGRLLLTESGDQAVRLWRAGDGRLLQSFQHESPLAGAGLTADERRVLTITGDGAAHIWTRSSEPGIEARLSIAPRDRVQQVDVSRDGRRAITLAAYTAQLWDLTAGGAPRMLDSWDQVNHAEFSPDGSLLLMADGFGEASVFRLDPFREVVVVRHEGAVLHASFSPDGRRFATASTDRVARVWDASSGAPVAPPLHHEATVTHVAFDVGLARLATATSDGLLRVWRLARSPAALRHEAVESAAFHPDGSRVLTVSPREVRLWDQHGASPPLTLSAGSQIYHAVLSPDGRRIVTASEDGRARIWDAATGTELRSLRHDLRVNHASFRPDGAWLATAGAAGPTRSEVNVWNVETGDKLFSLPHPSERANRVEFAPDGKRLLTLGLGAVSVWDLTQRRKLDGFHVDDARRASFSPDGTLLMVLRGTAGVQVYDAARGSAVSAPMKHENYRVDHAAFGPDSRTVVIVGGGYARIWDARSGRPLIPPVRHAPRTDVTYATPSPDGRFLATAASDGSARLWHARTGQPLTPPLVHGRHLRHLAFSPGGSRIVTAGGDAARVWPISGEALPQPDEQLLRSVRVLAARRIDATGGIVPLGGPEFREAWKALRLPSSPPP